MPPQVTILSMQPLPERVAIRTLDPVAMTRGLSADDVSCCRF
jgi:hypothetical protein